MVTQTSRTDTGSESPDEKDNQMSPSKRAAVAPATSEPVLVNLDPATILAEAENNVRFGDLTGGVEELKASIAEVGGVLQPVLVMPLDPPQGKFSYLLRAGFRRHKAVSELNKVGAGMTIPAVIRTDGDILREQIAENLQRKNLSPMDTAVALKKAFDSGLTRQQVRELFPRPSGKKGAPEPASNAWVNMILSFLDLPKEMQKDIHEGSIGVKAAYQLTRIAPDKRAAVVERAKADRQKEIDNEAAEEQKWLDANKRLEEAQKKAEETEGQLGAAQAEVELAEVAVNQAQQTATGLYQTTLKATGDNKKKALEAFKAAETDAKGAEKKLVEAQKALSKLKGVSEKSSKTVTAIKEKLEAARSAKAAKPAGGKVKPVSEGDVSKAAKAVGAEGGPVKLNAADMRKTIEDLALPGTYPMVAAIGAAIKECFDGITTPGQMLKKLAKLTGEDKKKK